MIPILDLQAQYATIGAELETAVLAVLRSGVYILGPEVEALERACAEYLGVPHSVGLASGTDALRLALDALGVQPDDEIITTPFSFIATANTISRAGATPVFADIDARTFNLDPEDVARRITPRTRGIIAVHLYGQPADMDALLALARQHGLWVLEDACQALGARWRGQPVGTLGVAGCFSFYPTKNLGAAGDAGLLCSTHAALVERVTLLARHGSRQRYNAETIGYNSRLDALQATILRVKLRYLDRWNAARRCIAEHYTELLRDTPVVPPYASPAAWHVYHQYTIRAPERDALAAFLADQGIGTMIYYPVPIHLQPLYRHLGYQPGSLPESERAAAEVLSLPIYPELSDAHLQEVVRQIRRFYGIG
ncbi:DegT/DnrJ/EryC1/StrS family aminotransferase [Kallotenue papyrolyticum]|uniref:DegT/DnrJ/EryC1/StrS family aminotransferase n=1 Tax=Kallotenue papyrolyticum TaxID=1325125 RepID=UPI00047865AC|nr:DegT/DnrJ/EryC1/StrS family aminotransferase [Kallotenue papyrolyticum]